MLYANGQNEGYTCFKLPKVSLAKDGKPGRTCSPALSTTFAAGTTDGPSEVDDFGQCLGFKPYWAP